MSLKELNALNPALAIALSVSLGGIINNAEAQIAFAQPYRPSSSCPPKHIATTAQRGCIPDQSADFEMGKGKYARSLTLPSASVSTVAPRSTDDVEKSSVGSALPKRIGG